MRKRNVISILLILVLLFSAFQLYGRKLDISVTTYTYNGYRAPDNAVVVWIQKPNGDFINTVHVWGTNVNFMLKNWRTASGLGQEGWYDGVTSATRTSHTPVQATWDCKDTNDIAVPNGTYEFWVEFLEDDYFWGQMNPDEVYFGKVAMGLIEIDSTDKTANGIDTSQYFSDFIAIYKANVGITIGNKKRNNNTPFYLRYNPLTQQLTIIVNKDAKQAPEVILITDLQGKVIKKMVLYGNRNAYWDLRGMNNQRVPSGIYFLEALSDNGMIMYPVHKVSITR